MRRYHIVEGDKTTVDGIVQPHTGNGAKVTWHGKIKSYIGDKVLCKACSSTGVIQASGSRLSFSAHKLMPALNDDLCICKCSPPPKLINSQTVFYETVSDEAINTTQNSDNISSQDKEKRIIDIFWSYGDDFIRLQDESRYYVDMNLHIKTENYNLGETVETVIKYEDEDILFNNEKTLILSGSVDNEGEVIFKELFKNGTLNLK